MLRIILLVLLAITSSAFLYRTALEGDKEVLRGPNGELDGPKAFQGRAGPGIHRTSGQANVIATRHSLDGSDGVRLMRSFGFSFPVRYEVGATVGAIAMADMTGDGWVELIAVGRPEDFRADVVVMEYRDGVLWERSRVSIDRHYEPWFGGIAVGDLNNDSRNDIVVGVHEAVAILLSNNKGNFDVSYVEKEWGRVDKVGLMDVDGDSHLDIIGTTPVPEHGFNQVYFGDGRGGVSFSQELATPQNAYTDLKIGDVNGDGFDDLLLTSGSSYYFWTFENNGEGGFDLPKVYEKPNPPGPGIYVVGGGAIADINSDGRNDVLITIRANVPQASVWVYEQGEDGSLQHPYMFNSADLAHAIVAEDFNNDGRDDVAVVHSGYGVLGLYLQKAEGGLAEEVLFPIVGLGVHGADWYNTQGVGVGDITRDGCMDIALGDYNFGVVLVEGKDCLPKYQRVTGGRLAPRRRQ